MDQNNTSENFDRFVELLNSIFELDKADLDFGIYRIMNIRRAETKKFLEKTLPKLVRESLFPYAGDRLSIKAKMGVLERQAASFNVKPDQSDEYKFLKEDYAKTTDLGGLETEVYSHLYNFFSRYYEEGDFISKRRYKEGVYAIPYEGEEVNLYWANQDQYYIKTSENFKDYSFTDEGRTVHFRIVDANSEQNNNKENGNSKREFMLWRPSKEKPDIKTIEESADHGELTIRFVYDIPTEKKKWSDENYKTIREAISSRFTKWLSLLAILPSSDPKKSKTLLQKHLETYAAKNTFDYFIHKDLKGFLSRELDFYIKNEIIHLDDIDTESEKDIDKNFGKVKAVKQVGKIIIDFLAQIENFQKKLWLKKKFVVSCGWCITLDRIPEFFYEEIRANKAQAREWIELYAIDKITSSGELELAEQWTDPPGIDFLKAHQNLIVDTRHFSRNFTEALIASIDDLDEKTDGVLVHSENFQALNLLQEKYRGKIKCIYIDPPYNADASEILYKNGFKHSSWLSMMDSRLELGKKILPEDGMLCLTIDDYEKDNASILLKRQFGNDSIKGIITIRNNPQGRSTVKGFAINHEYALFTTKGDKLKSVGRLEHSQKQKDRYSEKDEKGSMFLWENFRKTGTDSNHTDRPKQFYPIYVDIRKSTFRIPKMVWDSSINGWKVKDKLKSGEVEILPVSDTGEEKVWKWGIERITENPEHIKIEIKGNDIQLYRRNYYNDEGSLPNTWWDKPQYAAGSHGTNLLTNLFGENRLFLFPKSVYAEMDCITVCNTMPDDIVLDYFAGSGTTGHAVINLNRDDDGGRKYILVEMGEYFNTVTKPRIQKAVYAKEWRDGKPVNRTTGVSQIIKYFRLESYEDTLNNIALSDETHDRAQDFQFDDYFVNYMLDTESSGSLLNLDRFQNPFEYQLKITEHNETKEKAVDLVETFNYLLGLEVKKFRTAPGFKSVEGTLPNGKKALVIWRVIAGKTDKDESSLEKYFVRLRKEIDFSAIDEVYINGDNTIANKKAAGETFEVRMIEPEFKNRMFNE